MAEPDAKPKPVKGLVEDVPLAPRTGKTAAIIEAVLKEKSKEKENKHVLERGDKPAEGPKTTPESYAQDLDESSVQHESDMEILRARRAALRQGKKTTSTDIGENEGMDEDPTINVDDGIRIEPFNMRREMEEGHFDEGGFYIANKDEEKEVLDAWLDTVDQGDNSSNFKDIQLRSKAENKIAKDFEKEAEPAGARVKLSTVLQELIDLLRPQEAPANALKRLAKGDADDEAPVGKLQLRPAKKGKEKPLTAKEKLALKRKEAAEKKASETQPKKKSGLTEWGYAADDTGGSSATDRVAGSSGAKKDNVKKVSTDVERVTELCDSLLGEGMMVLQLSREKLAMEVMPKVVAKETKDTPAEAQENPTTTASAEAKKPAAPDTSADSLLEDLQDDNDAKAAEPQAKRQKTAPQVDAAYAAALAEGKNVKLKIDASATEPSAEAAVPTGDDEVFWQYRWKDDKEEKSYGPFQSFSMQGWIQQGCISAERPALVQACSRDGTPRESCWRSFDAVNFELYT